jgi:hypothetical protein
LKTLGKFYLLYFGANAKVVFGGRASKAACTKSNQEMKMSITKSEIEKLNMGLRGKRIRPAGMEVA